MDDILLQVIKYRPTSEALEIINEMDYIPDIDKLLKEHHFKKETYNALMKRRRELIEIIEAEESEQNEFDYIYFDFQNGDRY